MSVKSFGNVRVLRHLYQHIAIPLRLSVKSLTVTNHPWNVGGRGGAHCTSVGGCWGHPPAVIFLRSTSSQSGSQLSNEDMKKAVDNISEKFSEAMELMNDARSSSGTIYFSEDMEDARTQVADTLEGYATLLEKLSDEQRKSVIQSVGLKMEELKTQMSLLEELARE